MNKLGLNEIRERFLSYYESKDHLRLPSFSLVPENDNSLLLINAGMAPLKRYFTGKEQPPSKRVATCQRCIRTPDIERVGKTSRHGTYFEMLGNFSFGDYFKTDAIKWAWEFLTVEMKIPADKLWVSVFEQDDEAAQIWKDVTNIAPERIVRLGKEDNFWEIGAGPCGPCSEIHYDRGEKFGCGNPDCAVGCDCDRYVEIWNLVFTQFDKDEKGNYNKLKTPNIDTGMGLERLAAVMQGAGNLFEVDTVRNIMRQASKIANVSYGDNEKINISLRVITDHIRGTVFMVSDGILPSNEGRGYVLRRLIRRASRHGKLLGIKTVFLHKLADAVIAENIREYPELAEKKEYIKSRILAEEENFEKTIDQGLSILNSFIEDIKKGGSDKLSGEDAFKLYDTYGFPFDLTLEILNENKIGADTDKFDILMQKQRQRAREARNESESAGWDEDIYNKLGSAPTEFIGYDSFECNAHITAIIKDNEMAQKACKGENAIILLDTTVFYGESGGQAGDSGFLIGNGAKVSVHNAKKLENGQILHMGKVEDGCISKGEIVTVKIDRQKRLNTSRNHSATHLLHRALKDVLGEHVNQSGSFVNDNYLRFDFTHFSALSEDELVKVEDEVNKAISSSLCVDISYSSLKEAKDEGVMALFGEKYGEQVRTVKMGGYSAELCGGCHVSDTSEIGIFKIIKESAVASGIRRIEAITGMAVLQNIREKDSLLRQTAALLKSSPADVAQKAESLLIDLKTADKQVEVLKGRLAAASVDSFIEGAVKVKDTFVITGRVDSLDLEGMRGLGDKLRDNVPNSVIVLASGKDGKATFVTMATKTAVDAGANAGSIVRDVAKIAGGGGGGKPESAQAGGKDISKINAALDAVVSITEKYI